ncbi:MAG: hypothetical protein IVW54_14590 [Candidatus Binataceae bacterium]|nr:hypothetical protein [Candidatus Binataceae bacterium]
MMRRFQYEAEIYQSFYCVPMAVRRKLDRVGIKVGLKQWQTLGRGERLAICHLPADSDEEVETLKLFIREAVQSKSGEEPKSLPESDRIAADPPSDPPASLIQNLSSIGITLDRQRWDRLDPDERYALVKLGAGKEFSHNLKAAAAEFLNHP